MLTIDESGILGGSLEGVQADEVVYLKSPNSGERIKPIYAVIHYTAGNFNGSVNWLRNPQSAVSAHTVTSKKGKIVQLVDFNHKAWHAGRSAWEGYTGLNSYSLGFELENLGAALPNWEPYPDIQIEALVQQLRVCFAYHSLRGVVGHEHIAPGRKFDPGPKFPWEALSEFPGAQQFVRLQNGDLR